eukprot:scaffold1504_cov417-Prasinococcus_capsulatus_cf.AAC.12
MRCKSNQVSREGGSLKLVPEGVEDLWQVYNLIAPGDRVEAITFRKVQRDTAMGTESERIKMKLGVEVEDIDFDAEVAQIRLRGRNYVENEHVKLGSYHTLELEPFRDFTLLKDQWDTYDIERVKQACNPTSSADLAEGLANVFLVGEALTVRRQRVEVTLPRKQGAAAAGYSKAIHKFYDRILDAVVQHINWEVVRCVVIAGPGMWKDNLLKHIHEEAVKREETALVENRDRFVCAHASSAYKLALKEVLASQAVMNRVQDTKAVKEVQALQDFFDMLAQDDYRAVYGPSEVSAAQDFGAIQTLLVSDYLFRSRRVGERARFVRLVEDVKELGGDVHIFSSMHVSGEQLKQLTGIAAILRFPCPQITDGGEA